MAQLAKQGDQLRSVCVLGQSLNALPGSLNSLRARTYSQADSQMRTSARTLSYTRPHARRPRMHNIRWPRVWQLHETGCGTT